jgi:hypothetical protein
MHLALSRDRMTQLDLRPLSIGELFDRAFVLYRRHFWLFVGLTAVPGVFALALTLAQAGFQAAVMPPPGAAPEAGPNPENVAAAVGFFFTMMGSMVIYWVVYMIAFGATTFAVSEIYVGRDVAILPVLGRMRGRIGALILLLIWIGIRLAAVGFGGFVLVALAIGAGGAVSPILGGLLALRFGAATAGLLLFMTLRYGLSVPALIVEGLSPHAAVRRSIELTDGRLGRVALLVLCATLITYATVVLFQGPFLAAGMVAGLETTAGFWLNVVGAVTGTVGTTLTTPFMIIGLALIYYDARIREEGFDVELALASLDR